MKEFRAYVCEVKKLCELPFDVSPMDIEWWHKYEIESKRLSPEAETFIELCENIGNVYTLENLQNALNYEDLNSHNIFIYITNNY